MALYDDKGVFQGIQPMGHTPSRLYSDTGKYLEEKPTIKPSLSFGEDLGQRVGQEWTGAAEKIVSSTKKGFQQLKEAQTERTVSGGLKKLVGGAIKLVTGTTTGAGQALFAPFSGIISKVMDATGVHPMDALTPEAHKRISDFTKTHPELTENVGDIIGALGTIYGIKGLQKPLSLSELKALPSQATEDVIGLVKTAKEKVSSRLAPKTREQILATPESELHKLSSRERSFYFDEKESQIKQQRISAEKQITSKMEQTMSELKTSGEKLQTEVHRVSSDKVIELRPKIRQEFANKSSQYRELVNNEMAEHANSSVNSDDLRSFIESKYADPAEQQSIIRTLGIPETGQTTIGNLYDKTLKLGQEIGGAAKRGSRVYTPSELITDKSIHTLVDFLGEKGVDLSKARQFWRQWAPMRDEIIRTAKPFNIRGTETSNLAGKLTEVATGTTKAGVNNSNFIKELENLVGEPITENTKTALAKLGENERKIVATEVESEIQQEMIKEASEKSLEKLKGQEFDIIQKSAKRKAVKNVIKTLIIGGGLYEAGKHGLGSVIGL